MRLSCHATFSMFQRCVPGIAQLDILPSIGRLSKQYKSKSPSLYMSKGDYSALCGDTTNRQRFLAMYGEMSIVNSMSMELCLLMSHLQLATSFVHLFAQSTSTTKIYTTWTI